MIINLFGFQPGLLGNFPGPYEEEMKEIADITGIPLGKVHFSAFKKFNKALKIFLLRYGIHTVKCTDLKYSSVEF